MVETAYSGVRPMNRMLLLVGMLVAFNAPSQASTGEYSRLSEGCRYYETVGNSGAYEECLSYVAAISDILAYWANYNLQACIPADSVANGQLASVVNKSLREHPEVTDESASALVAASLSSAFACKR